MSKRVAKKVASHSAKAFAYAWVKIRGLFVSVVRRPSKKLGQ